QKPVEEKAVLVLAGVHYEETPSTPASDTTASTFVTVFRDIKLSWTQTFAPVARFLDNVPTHKQDTATYAATPINTGRNNALNVDVSVTNRVQANRATGTVNSDQQFFAPRAAASDPYALPDIGGCTGTCTINSAKHAVYSYLPPNAAISALSVTGTYKDDHTVLVLDE